MKSDPPPGAKGTTILIGLDGYACANTGADALIVVTATSGRANLERIAGVILFASWWWERGQKTFGGTGCQRRGFQLRDQLFPARGKFRSWHERSNVERYDELPAAAASFSNLAPCSTPVICIHFSLAENRSIDQGRTIVTRAEAATTGRAGKSRQRGRSPASTTKTCCLPPSPPVRTPTDRRAESPASVPPPPAARGRRRAGASRPSGTGAPTCRPGTSKSRAAA